MSEQRNKPEKFIKYVNFDLYKAELHKHFGKNTAKAYAEIKKFFLENDFEHRQYSGYISKNPLSDYQFSKIMEKFAKSNRWLKDCLKDCDILNVQNKEKISITEQICNIAQEADEQEKTKAEVLATKLYREVKYYKERAKVLLPDARIRTENNIMDMCLTLMKSGVVIDKEAFKVFQSIAEQRSKGR